ncbi:hypothetical protein chiPu_0010504 [Chiloscyllium punctatum]|uniref:Uncharacterized protein n=1 Tax=Chiloscyllium punctatum TaxID=137246 RepID=A0A401SNR7_CHIPU|nr:hypothetical protein [Chiloscyllium punctatum]
MEQGESLALAVDFREEYWSRKLSRSSNNARECPPKRGDTGLAPPLKIGIVCYPQAGTYGNAWAEGEILAMQNIKQVIVSAQLSEWVVNVPGNIGIKYDRAKRSYLQPTLDLWRECRPPH